MYRRLDKSVPTSKQTNKNKTTKKFWSQSRYFLNKKYFMKYGIVQVHHPSCPPNRIQFDFFFFLKLKINLKVDTWRCEEH